jgi:hypothetical protein
MVLPLGRPIRDNHDMNCRLLPMATLVVLLGGCPLKSEPPPPSAPASSESLTHDSFDLPLIIHIEVPETPPEIEGPSPPIEETPGSS